MSPLATGLMGLGVLFVWQLVSTAVFVWYLKTHCKYNSDIPYDPTQLDRITAKQTRATRLSMLNNVVALAIFLVWNWLR